MTTETKPKGKSKPDEADEVGVKPAFALNSIVYGKSQRAEPRSIFVPVSQAERDELVALEAIRDLTPDEAKLFKLTQSDISDALG